MIEKFYQRLENDRNLLGFINKEMEKARDEEHKTQIILECAQLAGIDLTVEEFKAYKKFGIEKLTQAEI